MKYSKFFYPSFYFLLFQIFIKNINRGLPAISNSQMLGSTCYGWSKVGSGRSDQGGSPSAQSGSSLRLDQVQVGPGLNEFGFVLQDQVRFACDLVQSTVGSKPRPTRVKCSFLCFPNIQRSSLSKELEKKYLNV